jgi:hypothetical protein
MGGYVARTGDEKYVQYSGRETSKETTQKTKHRWEDNKGMDLNVTVWEGVDWIQLAQDRGSGYCEHGNEPPGYIKIGEVLD